VAVLFLLVTSSASLNFDLYFYLLTSVGRSDASSAENEKRGRVHDFRVAREADDGNRRSTLIVDSKG
jgi:hypothetical protein